MDEEDRSRAELRRRRAENYAQKKKKKRRPVASHVAGSRAITLLPATVLTSTASA